MRPLPPAGAVHDGGLGTRPDREHWGRRALPVPLAPARGDASGAGAVAPAGGGRASLGPPGGPPRPAGTVQRGAQEPLRRAAHGGRTEPGDPAAKDRSAGTAYGRVIPALLNRSVF